MSDKKKVSIKELEGILNGPEDNYKIRINPDGSITTAKNENEQQGASDYCNRCDRKGFELFMVSYYNGYGKDGDNTHQKRVCRDCRAQLEGFMIKALASAEYVTKLHAAEEREAAMRKALEDHVAPRQWNEYAKKELRHCSECFSVFADDTQPDSRHLDSCSVGQALSAAPEGRVEKLEKVAEAAKNAAKEFGDNFQYQSMRELDAALLALSNLDGEG